jgi:hypothetical protein
MNHDESIYFWVGNALLGVNDARFRHDALLVDDARFHNDLWHVRQSRLTDFLHLRHDVLVNHSALCINHFLLAHNSGRLLDLYKLGSTFLWWTDLRALWHGAEILSCVAFRSTLRKTNGDMTKLKVIDFLWI